MSEFVMPKVLLVDDEEGLTEIMRDLLLLEGYDVRCTSGGKEAIEVIPDYQPDVVISDVRMPDGDGLMLLEAIQATVVKRPIVAMMTGFSDYPEQHLLSRGASKVFFKPMQIVDIVQFIKDELANRKS